MCASLSLNPVSQQQEEKWFVLKCQPKRESLAAAALRERKVGAVLNPRIRFQRSTRRGRVWFVESLFPGYLFARFSEEHDLRRVQAAPGVAGVVRFGKVCAVLEETVVEELKKLFQEGGDETIMIETGLETGSIVHVMQGPFLGVEGIVREYRPAKERVKLLLDFLGQQVEAEFHASSVQTPEHPRTEILRGRLKK